MCRGNRGESGDDGGPISPNRIESRSRRREANLGSSSAAAAGNGAIQIHAWPLSHLCHARTHDLIDRALDFGLFLAVKQRHHFRH